MSTTTLESLKADFYAERRAFISECLPSNDALTLLMRLLMRLVSAEQLARWEARDSNRKLRLAATNYIVARRNGVGAAMLYKLSDGTMPGKAGAK